MANETGVSILCSNVHPQRRVQYHSLIGCNTRRLCKQKVVKVVVYVHNMAINNKVIKLAKLFRKEVVTTSKRWLIIAVIIAMGILHAK